MRAALIEGNAFEFPLDLHLLLVPLSTPVSPIVIAVEIQQLTQNA
jgi:hypothetical protein